MPKLTSKELAKLGIKIPTQKFRSGWENDYTKRLSRLESEGKILCWGYERFTFRIGAAPTTKNGRDATYTPDIYIIDSMGRLFLIEIKGFRRAISAVKMKAFADEYPFPLLVVGKVNGSWQIIEGYNYDTNSDLIY